MDANNEYPRSIPIIGPGGLERADWSRKPSNTSERTLHKLSNEKPFAASTNEPPVNVLSNGIPSPGGPVGQTYTEKVRGQSIQRIQYRQSTARSQARKSSLKDNASATMQNGTTYHTSMAEPSKSPISPKRKKSGLGTVIRRIFGRRSVKNRISLPAPVEHRYHDPHTFITSPSESEPQRAASAPSAEILRSSALGSHAPLVVNTQKDFRDPHISDEDAPPPPEIPPEPERLPPERPTRPRRASLPSVILSSQEAEDINNALTGLGLQDVGNQAEDRHDIGFAVTSGSNPKRRSRSVGAYRSTAKEHRMSPIQWRQWRRRSDEIRYWRGSTTDDDPIPPSTILQPGLVDPEPESTEADHTAKIVSDGGQENSRAFEAHNQGFNFGLPMVDLHSNEHVGLEERMITLELKLMDLDYALSKLSAGSFSPPNQHQRPEGFSGGPAAPTHGRSMSDQPRMLANKTAGPFVEDYPSLAYYQTGGTPNTQQGSFQIWQEPASIHPKIRPTSIATTLKASGTGQDQGSGPRSSIDRSYRTSMTELTIEHYTTLITLIRREQSARMRLEDQVSELQRQIEVLQGKSSPLRSRREQQNLGRHFSPDDVRRPHELGVDDRPQRGRSSNYSGETDTDDDNFHDVYVTPVERGEFERGDFDGIEEGVAF